MQVIDAKTKIDSLKIALDVMLGSKKESTQLYNDIVTLAKKTPFSLDEVAENVVKLKAYNIATQDLIPTVEALGNISAAVGKEKLPQLTLAYGQVMNMGRLMGTETKQFIFRKRNQKSTYKNRNLNTFIGLNTLLSFRFLLIKSV